MLWRSEHLPTLTQLTIIHDGVAVHPKMRHTSITYQLVLVGRDSSEDCLHEHEGPELLRLEVEQRGRVVLLLNDMDPRLVLVHGVEDYLKDHDRATQHVTSDQSDNFVLSPTSEKRPFTILMFSK